MEIFGVALDPGQWTWSQTYAVAQLLGQIVGILNIPSVLLRRSHRPMAQLTWILALVSLPFLGVIMWWAIGRTHLERKRRRRARALAVVNKSLSTLGVEQEEDPDNAFELSPSAPMLLYDNEVFRTTPQNNVEVLISGREAYPEMEEAIRNARHHIHLQFYIWQRDAVGERIRDLLVEKAREGVEVRLLYDAFGAATIGWGGFMKPLVEAGGRVAQFLPFRLERSLRINFRNHRKIVVVDGEIGFTGGLNIGEEYNDWFDLALRVEGPVVNQLQEVFAEDWHFATRENIASTDYFRGAPPKGEPAEGVSTEVLARVVASGPDNWQSITHVMFFLAITSAQERIWITTPYFIPDIAIMTALRTAAMRGVDVRLMLPGKSDVPLARFAGRGHFEELLEVGVKLYEYQPRVLHAKILLFDQQWTIVGSSNMDNRSFHLQFEVNLALESEQVNERFAREFQERLIDSVQLDAAQWKQRSTAQRIGEAAARLLSPVL